MLDVGDTMPKLSVSNDAGETVVTTELADKYVVLYFYPKDDTSGCTNEALQFRDAIAAFRKKRARVVGASRDSVASHQKFKKKFDLPYPLLADVDSKLCDAFGTIVDKSMYGRKYKGVARATFLIDASGRILRAWPKVKVEGHVAEVLASIT